MNNKIYRALLVNDLAWQEVLDFVERNRFILKFLSGFLKFDNLVFSAFNDSFDLIGLVEDEIDRIESEANRSYDRLLESYYD